MIFNDGRITVTDSQLIARVSSSLESSNCASDYDRNGRTNILDALKVAQIAVGTRIHSTGTCDNPNKQFVCGDVNGDARITQRDVDDLSQAIAGSFACDGVTLCPTIGTACPLGEYCYPNAPVGFDERCGDVVDSNPAAICGLHPDGVIDRDDVDAVRYYLLGSECILDGCYAPCRDPRSIPPPVPLRKPSGMKR